MPPAATAMLARIASPFAVGVSARIAGQAISFALVVVASRFLGLAEFGVYALAWAGAVIATTFVFTGFYHAILRSTDLERDIHTLFWAMVGVGALGSAILLGIGLLAGGSGTDLGIALLVAAPLPLMAAPTAWNEAQMVRATRARAASLYIVVAEGVALAVAILGLQAGYGVLALLGARHVAVAIGILLTSALVRRLPRLSVGRTGLAENARTAVPLWGTTAIGMFSNYGADMVLALYLSPAAVGAYRSGARIAMTAADIVFQPLRMLSWSRFARLEQEGRSGDIRLAWCENMALSCAMLWPVMAGIGLMADALVVTIFDPSWAAAAPVLAVLAISRSASAPIALMEPALMCMNRAALQFGLRLASGALLLVALLVLGRYGAVAAAWAMTLTMAIMGCVVLTALVRVLGVSGRMLVHTFIPGLGVAALCGATVVGLDAALAGASPANAVLVVTGVTALVWLMAIVALLRLGVLRLPKP